MQLKNCMVLCVAAPATILHEVLGHRPQPVVFGLIWLWIRNSLRENGSHTPNLLILVLQAP